jgi:hypothetical protein
VLLLLSLVPIMVSFATVDPHLLRVSRLRVVRITIHAVERGRPRVALDRALRLACLAFRASLLGGFVAGSWHLGPLAGPSLRGHKKG